MVSNAASWWWEGCPADPSGPGDDESGGGTPPAAPPPPVARRPTTTGGLVMAVVLLSTGAAVGMSSIAGFGHVWHRLALFDWPWVVASAAGVVAALAGYRTAFDGVVWGGHHRVLTRRQRLGVVAAGFGAFVPRGGTAIDRYVMSVTGHLRRDSDVRLATLQVLEMVPLTIGATTAAYAALLLSGGDRPPFSFVVPWAIGPIVGAPLVLWSASRYRTRLRRFDRGWRYWLGVSLDGVWALVSGLAADRRNRTSFLGMTVFAAGELFAVWAAMAGFGFTMSGEGIVLGYGVGYLISRRSAPFGGAGLIDVMLIVALANAGAPLSAAIVGTFAYRVFNLWCPMPFSMAAMPGVARLAAAPGPRAGTNGRSDLPLE
jgi:hypothetical protein